MKSGRVKGGAAIPAVIDTGRRTRSNMAQPVFNASGLNRGVQGGAAQNIIQITSEDLVQNGGQYKLIGGAPISMEIVTGRRSMQGAATVVYPVDVLGNYDPSFAGYIYKILNAPSAANLIGFWTQNELAGGISYDHSVYGHDGAYTAVNLGQPGIPGLGMSSAGYDGATSFNNVFSVSFRALFDGDVGSMIVPAQMAAGGWVDAAEHGIIHMGADANNYMRIYKTTTNNTLRFRRQAAGVPEFFDHVAAPTGFVTYGMTWDFTGDAMAYYADGVPLGGDAGLLAWAGPLVNTLTVIGAISTVPASVWLGNVGPIPIYNAVLSPTEMLDLSTT